MVFCGIDIGTTSTKAVVLDRDGHVLEEATFPAPAGVGEAAQVYWHDHFCRVMDHFAAGGRFRGQEVACSVTGQGGSFVLADGRFRPVSDARSWTELADEAVVQELVDTFGKARYYHWTGWPPHGWLAACKLREMVARKQVSDDARHVATVPDFIYAQVTGEAVTDITSAQITGLADFRESQWSHDIAAWTGIREELLPRIVPDLQVVAQGVRTTWGRLTLVTGSHDQYAAMEAAGLARDRTVMLGTGTAWVINGRTERALFDDERFLIHPGRDVHPDGYGFIVTLWQIGAGFDALLNRLGLTQASPARIEEGLMDLGVPEGPVTVDLNTGVLEPAGDAVLSVRRYMEWSGSVVAHGLDRCGMGRGLERIVVTGGAMRSRLWPQVIADVCDLIVEAVDCPYFTAYGAALHAHETLLGPRESRRFPDTAFVRTYTPQQSQQYRAWYHDCQKPVLDAIGEM